METPRNDIYLFRYLFTVTMKEETFILLWLTTTLAIPFGTKKIYLLFNRSYCYTVWSAIGIILWSVRLSVCLWRCVLWLSELVYAAKSCTSVFLLAGTFLIVPSDTFSVGCIV